MADFIEFGTQGESINTANVRKTLTRGAQLVIEHNDGSEPTVYDYADAPAARAARSNLNALLGVKTMGVPAISAVTPGNVLKSALPVTVTVTGVNFDSTAAIVLKDYLGVDTVLSTTFVDSQTLSCVLPNTLLQSVDDVVYGDTPGNTYVLKNGLTIY